MGQVCAWRRSAGQTLIEFALTVLLTMMLLLGVIEISRMALVYTCVANAARVGARYASVHGAYRTGSGASGPSGPAANPPEVVTVVKNFASAGLLRTSSLLITVSYPGGSNAPGQLVSVQVVYPYDPLASFFRLRVRLGSISEGVILF